MFSFFGKGEGEVRRAVRYVCGGGMTYPCLMCMGVARMGVAQYLQQSVDGEGLPYGAVLGSVMEGSVLHRVIHLCLK